MSVWVCVPSKRPPAEVERWARAWHDMGYRVALWRDIGNYDHPPVEFSAYDTNPGDYPGYAVATNRLIDQVIEKDDTARWFVIGGDDVYPDTTKRADEIAAECEAHFNHSPGWITHVMGKVDMQAGTCESLRQTPEQAATFGVMQPTGDRWADGEWGFSNAPIDRVAGSAWIGREFALRAYGGKGPLWPEYVHMFVDEELQRVAEKLGVFWQRRDLTQMHNHWARGNDKTRAKDMPAFLAEANSPEHWAKYKALFEARAAAGFPGHEVKP